MEVHHKHHIPKKITEYFTEFLMLFTAVTLGFFAENYREHSLIEAKMQENYESLVEDLRSDSTKMTSLIASYKQGDSTLLQFDNLLYDYHTGAISYEQLVGVFKTMKPFPSYNTVFINNTTFKNVQSSGMLSYISSRSLRFEISYYYEVMFKQLQDNNALFDKDGMDFFDRNLPIGHLLRVRKYQVTNTDKKREKSARTQEDTYENFIFQLPETKKIFTSDKLIFQSKVYRDRYAAYNYLLIKMMEKNALLLKELRSIQH
jgi:hypothetical protein